MITRFVISMFAALLLQAQANAKGIHLKAGVFNPKSMTMNQVLFVSKQLETNYFIVQFKDTVSEEIRTLMKNENVQVVRYIPDDAYLVKAQSEAVLSLELSGLVEGVLPYLGSFKVSPAFNDFDASLPTDIIVQLTNISEKQNVINALGGINLVSDQGRFLHVKGNNEDIGFMSTLDGVEWIQPKAVHKMMHVEWGEITDPNTEIKADGDYTDLNGFESGVKVMNFEKAWSRGFKGAGQIVAMADTGLDSGILTTLSGDFNGVIEGQALGLFSDSWGDPMGHGTHVSGSIIGKGIDSKGIITGGAIETGLIAQGMWSKIFKNLTIPPDLKILFQKAYDKGARIHTNSWGSPANLGAYDKNSALVDEFMWENPDMLIIFAAGNSGVDHSRDGRVDPGSVSTPGTAKNALTVGASENLVSNGGIQRPHSELRNGEKNWGVSPLAEDTLSNNMNGVAVFSSRGPAKDGRLKPDVVAPGTNVLSNCSREEGASPLWGAYNKEYCWSGGTSMSTPLTAGAAAVAREYLMKQAKQTAPSAALVKALLMHTAVDMFPGQYGFRDQGQEMLIPAPNNQQGFGRVDMNNVTEVYGLAKVIDHKEGVAEGQDLVFDIESDGASEVVITLVYTDAPGSPTASKALVNDLNMSLSFKSSGKTLVSERALDNFEQIKSSDVSKGESLTLTVKAQRIAQGKAGKQPFAVLVTLK